MLTRALLAMSGCYPQGLGVEGAEGLGQEGWWAGSPEAGLQLRSSLSGRIGPGGRLIPFGGWRWGSFPPLLLEADQLPRNMETVIAY